MVTVTVVVTADGGDGAVSLHVADPCFSCKLRRSCRYKDGIAKKMHVAISPDDIAISLGQASMSEGDGGAEDGHGGDGDESPPTLAGGADSAANAMFLITADLLERFSPAAAEEREEGGEYYGQTLLEQYRNEAS